MENGNGYTPCFGVFVNHNNKIYMLQASKHALPNKRIVKQCNLEEKEKIINGLKLPNSVVLRENISKLHYVNLPNAGFIDEFNNKTEQEIIQTEEAQQNLMREAFGVNPNPIVIDPKRVNIHDIYDGIPLGSYNYAINFLSDTQAKYTKFEVAMHGVDNYTVTLDEAQVDIDSLLAKRALDIDYKQYPRDLTSVEEKEIQKHLKK